MTVAEADPPLVVRRSGAERVGAIEGGDRLVIALPARSPVADFSLEWWRIDGDGARGGGGRWPDPALEEALARPDAARRVLAIAPATCVALHWLAMPDLTPRQAGVAARLKVADEAAAGSDELHVVAGAHRPGDGAVAVAVVDRAVMADWLDWCSRHRLDPDVIVPAALLLPAPETDTVHRAAVAGPFVFRGHDSGWQADEDLDALLIGGDEVVDVDEVALDGAVVAAFDAPVINLRSGEFAKRRRGVDRRMITRVVVILLLCGLLELLIAGATVLRYSVAADGLDDQARALAAPAVPAGTAVDQIVPALDDALARRGSGPNAFGVPAAGLYAALSAAPSAVIGGLTFSPDGTLGADVSAPTIEELNGVLLALQRDGFTVSYTNAQGTNGRQAIALTVRGSKR